ncbi:MAG TPA: hypothetical protein VHQ90_26580 [Thermoanaerobaculia bacterium]|nr:hypothetical protein [Thermoanaerobaculia bacterium]
MRRRKLLFELPQELLMRRQKTPLTAAPAGDILALPSAVRPCQGTAVRVLSVVTGA